MAVSPTQGRRRQIWEVYWQPGLPWYPAVMEVAEQFGVTRQAVHAVKRWAVANGLPVRTGRFFRYRLSPFDALSLCRRLWGVDGNMDMSARVEDICAEYGITKSTAYTVYRPRFKSGELQRHCDELDAAWRADLG